MGKSIFELENRLDIQHEFYKFIEVLHRKDNIFAYPEGCWRPFVKVVDCHVFKKWKYRDTILTVNEYLDFIGINRYIIEGRQPISEEVFLYYLEFILNMYNMLYKECNVNQCNDDFFAIIQNVSIILEKMNYKSQEVGDKIIITKRDADVDVILDKVPENISDILLQYNDFRIKDHLESKKKILKDIDLYIEENINIKSFDKELDDSIGVIVNKMGVNHPINEAPYDKLSEKQLLEWYDKCFLLMIHAIRMVKVKEIKEERKIFSKG